MFNQFLQLTIRRVTKRALYCVFTTLPASSSLKRASNLSNISTGVFLWHADRLCWKKQLAKSQRTTKTPLMLTPPPAKLMLNAPKAPKISQIPLDWYNKDTNWRPGNFVIAKQGFEIPAWLSAFAKNKFVVLAAKAAVIGATLYLVIVSCFAFIVIYIINALDKMKR